MMISSTYLKRQSIVMNPKALETDRKIASILFNDQADGVSSKDLNAIAALTFNPKPAQDIYRILTGALDMQQNSWQTLLKALIVANHLVRFGAERCVDHSWEILRRIESLVTYNSALIRTTFGTMGGRDNGLPVRQRAGPFVELLNSPDAIRQVRLDNQDKQGAICPDLGSDDYTAKGGGIIAFGADTMAVQEQGIAVMKDNSAFGSEAGKTLAAKFDLSHVPGMYEGRPDRFFDDVQDVRNHKASEDSHITRNALAPDLLDLDFGGQVVSSDFPQEVVNLAQSLNEQKLQAQLKAQQEQLEMMQAAMQSNRDLNQGRQSNATDPLQKLDFQNSGPSQGMQGNGPSLDIFGLDAPSNPPKPPQIQGGLTPGGMGMSEQGLPFGKPTSMQGQGGMPGALQGQGGMPGGLQGQGGMPGAMQGQGGMPGAMQGQGGMPGGLQGQGGMPGGLQGQGGMPGGMHGQGGMPGAMHGQGGMPGAMQGQGGMPGGLQGQGGIPGGRQGGMPGVMHGQGGLPGGIQGQGSMSGGMHGHGVSGGVYGQGMSGGVQGQCDPNAQLRQLELLRAQLAQQEQLLQQQSLR